MTGPQIIPGWTIGGFLPLTLSRELAGDISFPSKLSTEDEKWMFVALLEGMKGSGISNPNPSVGCVVVKDGKQIASGSTEAFKLRHSERVAFSQIPHDIDLLKCTAYVTLEPCSHQGHQPPCVDLLIEKKIGRVVVAFQDPNPKVAGAGLEKLKLSGINVTVGVLKREAQLWHLPFLGYHRLQRPVLIGKWAQTKNGLLADDTGRPIAISGPASRAYGHWLRQKYDAILVGAGTVLKDHPNLSVRDCRAPISRQPLRIVVDLRGRVSAITPELMKTTFSEEAKTVLILAEGLPVPAKLPKSVQVTRLGKGDLVTELQSWLASDAASQVFGKPLQSVYVEGGPTLLGLFLKNSAFDILHVFTGEKALEGKKNGLAFEKFENEFHKVTENLIQQDTLREYVKSSFWNQL